MSIVFKALSTKDARALQAGGLDSNGQLPERQVSDGEGNPCRHCLQYIAKGKEMLVLGHRPFGSVQPYAEMGPIFLCADACERNEETSNLPVVIETRPRFIVRGYTADERIRYGTGDVVETEDIIEACEARFEDPEIAFIHVRSASNNCFYCRVERARPSALYG
ncbi:DUF1203 domain-containing protein [Hoeflea sp. TYP-13]|uniref:DUF1203 domain-containing protein n=1 Tax=Hoeflea sp. TYP-13 TaxID=3230023 RepID=UPI0034C65E66